MISPATLFLASLVFGLVIACGPTPPPKTTAATPNDLRRWTAVLVTEAGFVVGSRSVPYLEPVMTAARCERGQEAENIEPIAQRDCGPMQWRIVRFVLATIDLQQWIAIYQEVR